MHPARAEVRALANAVLVAALGWRGALGCGGRSDIGAGELAAGPTSPTGVAPCPATGVPVTLTTGPQGGGPIVVDATNVYWTVTEYSFGPGGGGLFQLLQCSKCGCDAPTVIAEDPVGLSGLAVDAASVYWIDGNGNVMKVPIGGGPFTTLAAAHASTVAVDANSVYWTDLSAVMKAPTGGGAPTTLVAGLAAPAGIALDDTHVYWADGVAGTIRRVSLDGGNPTTVAAGQTPSAFAVDATSVYWTNYDGGQPGATVMKVALTGGSPTTLAGTLSPYGIAVDATTVYWTSDGAVRSVPKEGGSPSRIFPVKLPSPGGPYYAPFGIAADSTGVYWDDFTSGAVGKWTPG